MDYLVEPQNVEPKHFWLRGESVAAISCSPEQYWRTYFKHFVRAAIDVGGDLQTEKIRAIGKCLSEALDELIKRPSQLGGEKNILDLCRKLSDLLTKLQESKELVPLCAAISARMLALAKHQGAELVLNGVLVFNFEKRNPETIVEDRASEKIMPVQIDGPSAKGQVVRDPTEYREDKRQVGKEEENKQQPKNKQQPIKLTELYNNFSKTQRLEQSEEPAYFVDSSAMRSEEGWRNELLTRVEKAQPSQSSNVRLSKLRPYLPICSGSEGFGGIALEWFGLERVGMGWACHTSTSNEVVSERDSQGRNDAYLRFVSAAHLLGVRCRILAKEADFIAEASALVGDGSAASLWWKMRDLINKARGYDLGPVALGGDVGNWLSCSAVEIAGRHEEDQALAYRRLLSYVVQHLQRYERVVVAYEGMVADLKSLEEGFSGRPMVWRLKESIEARLEAFSADYLERRDRAERNQRRFMEMLSLAAAVFVLFSIGQTLGGYIQNRNNADERAFQTLMGWRVTNEEMSCDPRSQACDPPRIFNPGATDSTARANPAGASAEPRAPPSASLSPSDLRKEYQRIQALDLKPYELGALMLLAGVAIGGVMWWRRIRTVVMALWQCLTHIDSEKRL